LQKLTTQSHAVAGLMQKSNIRKNFNLKMLFRERTLDVGNVCRRAINLYAGTLYNVTNYQP